MILARRPGTDTVFYASAGRSDKSTEDEPPAPDHPMAAQALQRLETRLRRELERDPLYAKYLECIAKNPADGACQVQLSDALYSASSHGFNPFVADEASQLKARTGSDLSALRGYLRSRTASTRDPVATMATVNLLLLSCPNGGFPLPSKAYGELAKRTAPEVEMILNGHGTEPFPTQEVRDQVLDMAMDPDADRRMRVFAMQTLGKTADDVPILGGIVDWVLTGDPASTFLAEWPLSRALARCGPPCDGIMEQLTADTSSAQARQIVSQTLVAVDESRRDTLLEYFRAAGLPVPVLPVAAAD
jgi:hypothetical protein